MAEKRLIEGVDAGGEPGIQGIDARVEGDDIGPHFLAELSHVLTLIVPQHLLLPLDAPPEHILKRGVTFACLDVL